MINLQHVVAILVNSDTDRKADKYCWRSIANREIETHRAVINIAHFSQHSIKMNAINGRPSESCQPRIMKANGDQLAWELKWN